MSRKNKVIIISIVVISLMMIWGIYQKKVEKEQRKQVVIQQMKDYLRDKYNEEFECVSSYSFIGAGELQHTFRGRFIPTGEPELEFNCTDNGSLGLSDGFLIVLGRKLMQPYGEKLCQQVFKNGERYLVYAEAIPDPEISYKVRPILQTFIENEVAGDVTFNIVVSLYGEYEKEDIKRKAYEVGQLMKKSGIRINGSVAIKVYDSSVEFIDDKGFNDDREGMLFKGILYRGYENEFTPEDVSIQDRFIL